MSRTVRRKGLNFARTRNSFAHEAEKDVKRTARWKEFWEQQTGHKVVYREEELRRTPAFLERRFHSDRGKYYSIPHWFCVLRYYGPERAAMRVACNRVLRCEDWEEVDVFTDIHTDLWHDWC